MPKGIDVTGTWTGVVPIKLPQGTGGSPARLSLVQSDTTVTGELISRGGARYPLSGGMRTGDEIQLLVGNLPGDSTCGGVGVIFSDFERVGGHVQRISGRTFGRCFGTIAGSLELRRAA